MTSDYLQYITMVHGKKGTGKRTQEKGHGKGRGTKKAHRKNGHRKKGHK